MKQGSNGRRSRRGGGKRNPRSQNFDSNGPDVRVRGNAQQVLDRYLTLARDAHAAGDRISSENYFQHAEHYYRILHANDDDRRDNDPRSRPSQPADTAFDTDTPQPGDLVAGEAAAANTATDDAPQAGSWERTDGAGHQGSDGAEAGEADDTGDTEPSSSESAVA